MARLGFNGVYGSVFLRAGTFAQLVSLMERWGELRAGRPAR